MKPALRTRLIVAADGAPPRFLGRDVRRGHWTVALEPDRALGFDSPTAAGEALADFLARQGAHLHTAPAGRWRVYRAASRTTFTPVE